MQMMNRISITLVLLLQPSRSMAFLNINPSSAIATLRTGTGRPVSNVMSSMSSVSEGSPVNSVKNFIASSSLASDYAIRINPPVFTSHENELGSGVYTSTWHFHLLDSWEPNSGRVDLSALNDCAQPTMSESTPDRISCSWEGPYDNQWYIEIDAKGVDLPKELACIMSRIMVQSAASHIATIHDPSSLLHLTVPTTTGETFQEFQCSQLVPTTGEGNDIGIRQLFQPLNADYANMELVDAVNQQGEILGSLPRPFVHKWNILHRGIGMIVSQDASILDGGNPNVYVHQRTDTKRIFPSLYDMFVGGVSCRGESPEVTAAREVAEELGLKGALEYQQDVTRFNPLSPELFKCTVCTAYNRCVVSMFTYQCMTDSESISWQEEEVQSGQFVNYDVVEVAAAISIDRLAQRDEWPGVAFEIDASEISENVANLKKQYGNNQVWESWDFVPDGLLVWVAWLKWLNSKTV
ncbi:hypothetical protein ACHAWO_004738 [Cyclotella atomus]|uniref:Nudix hydrolase domain-containing protein n=1 Tax=Cyclotella atomus TaxID=382360 RepID=A0ABD3QTY4_9STRA